MDKKNVLWEYIRVAIWTIAALIGAFIILSFVGQRTEVNGASMYPTLESGDSVWVNKLAYKVGDIERYDVVIFPYYNKSLGKEVYYIKRIIGMPGELIQIQDGVIYIDGEQITESYGYYDKDYPYYNGIAAEEMYIGENEYFVLGDNRNNSEDSRSIGCITKDMIIGEALVKWMQKR